jgi:hypothetical protein
MEQSRASEPKVEITITGQAERPIVYANHAEVQKTPWETIISFAIIDPATLTASEDGKPSVEAVTVVRLALPRVVSQELQKAIARLLPEDQTPAEPAAAMGE